MGMNMVKAITVKTYVLELTEQEAHFLKGWMQNPLSDKEHPLASKCRENIFYGLKDVLENN